MSFSQHHGCCQYQKSISIPWVFANTMSPCLNHESMSIPWVHVCTMSLCQTHASITINFGNFNFWAKLYLLSITIGANWPKHNLVHFKNVSWFHFTKSWSSFHHLYAGQRCNGNSISTVPPCYPFHISSEFFHWEAKFKLSWWSDSDVS